MSTTAEFTVFERSIAELHEAIRSGAATARAIAQASLDRIEAFDRKGPALWSIICTNPSALEDAEALDQHFRQTGRFKGPLHGIPVLVKDNYDVAGMQTTGGSAALLGWTPATDSAAVARMRAAGAVILAKSTMSEWARGGLDNVNSVLPAFARNPYNTAHATGGSSGGTGSGLASSFAVVGLGSDTWGSIRNPSANNALAGLRPSWGLVSRAGMIGLYDARDTAGPMARSVTDLAVLLDVIAGADENDPATREAAGRPTTAFTEHLDPHGIAGKSFGVLRQAVPAHASDPEVVALFDAAIARIRELGGRVVDPFVIPQFDEFPPRLHPDSEMRAAIEKYLRTTGPGYPRTLAEVVASGKFHPVHEVGLRALAVAPSPSEDPKVRQLESDEVRMRATYEAAMATASVEFILAPVATFPPKLNGDRNLTPTGSTTWMASGLHWPAIAVPMGFCSENLPTSLQIIGRPWSEAGLIEAAFAFEQATRHRRPPATIRCPHHRCTCIGVR